LRGATIRIGRDTASRRPGRYLAALCPAVVEIGRVAGDICVAFCERPMTVSVCLCELRMENVCLCEQGLRVIFFLARSSPTKLLRCRDITESGSSPPSGLNRTLGTRPRPSSQLAEERRGPARLQTFGRSRAGGERTLRLTGVGPSRQIRRIFSYRTFLKVFDLPVKSHPMMFRPLEYR
jgi:hypothetical protein